MPKVDVFFNPGDELPEKLQIVLSNYFTIDDFEKLKKFGGRIQLSITAPFTDRKAQNSDLVVDNKFINNLKNNPFQAIEILKTLTKEQLYSVAELLNFPITVKASINEVRKSLTDYLNSGEKWKNISG